jgi:tRNA nucleotidyltransferase/poly(A) polymerase
MSDYIFMLESHLNPDQNRVVEEVQAAAGLSSVNVFLTGGAMRDMLGGFRVRDLDFSVEGNALKVANAVVAKSGAQLVSADEHRKVAELVFPSGVTAQIAMSRQEKYGKPGVKPQVTAATIQEDLRGRDFTINAIALSLNKASRGLLLDPMNGLADLERHELRTVGTYGFYDDPVRLLRLVRFRVRFGFTVEDRTRQQFENAREAEVEKYITARAFFDELRRISTEDTAADIIRALDELKMLTWFVPALTGPKVPLVALGKYEKAIPILPDDIASRAARFGPFLGVLADKLTPKEKQALIKTLEMRKAEVELWQKVEPRAKKLETALKSARIRKPSHVYQVLVKAEADEVLYLLCHSTLKPVQDRIRNYYEKYLPASLEVAPEEFAGIQAKPGTPKYAKAYEEVVWKVLDRRPKKIVEPEEVPVPAEPVPPPPPPPVAGRGRGR